MRRAAALALALALPLAGACSKSKPPPPPPAPPDAGPPDAGAEGPDAGLSRLAATALTWPRMRADRFGCFLERELGVRDPRFSCATRHYENHGDPCKDPETYAEGPAVPDSVVDRLDPALTSVELAWEHGDLQAVTLTFDGVLTPAEAYRRVGLPPRGEPLPANVQSARVEACSKATTCLTLEGFDHQGAGDVECPE